MLTFEEYKSKYFQATIKEKVTQLVIELENKTYNEVQKERSYWCRKRKWETWEEDCNREIYRNNERIGWLLEEIYKEIDEMERNIEEYERSDGYKAVSGMQ